MTSECPLDAGWRRRNETTAHILWECNKAIVAWGKLLGRWAQAKLTSTSEQTRLAAAQPSIASRQAPPPAPGLVRDIDEQYGFTVDAHADALAQIWLTFTTSITTTLRQERNDMEHKGIAIRQAEVAERAWAAGTRQARPVSEQRVRARETREVGIAMWRCTNILENREPQLQHEGWSTVHLHFDGGARGNLGPSGSGWVLLNQRAEGTWDLDACGYKYQGDNQTNNFSEYEATMGTHGGSLAAKKQRGNPPPTSRGQQYDHSTNNGSSGSQSSRPAGERNESCQDKLIVRLGLLGTRAQREEQDG